jgi:hypothetical protein
MIADPMGLGNTLTMIALVAASVVQNPPTIGFGSEDSNRCTLVVVPPPRRESQFMVSVKLLLTLLLVLDTWEEQLIEYGSCDYLRK